MRPVVSNYEQIGENCLYFGEQLANRDQYALDLLRRGRNFVVADTNDGLVFVPSRFAGYADNEFETHKADSAKDGRKTDPAISGILGRMHEENHTRENQYRLLVQELGLSLPAHTRTYWDSLVPARIERGQANTGGKRAEATWEDRHSPLVKEIASILYDLGCRESNGNPWFPDLIWTTPTGKELIVEVKPDARLHNVITAIGQSICYRSGKPRFISIIAAPGMREIGQIAEVLQAHDIYAVDLDEDIWQQFRNFICQ